MAIYKKLSKKLSIICCREKLSRNSNLRMRVREREIKEIMRNLGKYVRKKKLEVNVEKTKMMEFNKRKMKNEESEWKWEESKIARVSEFKYLGYTFNKTNKVHIWIRLGNRREKVGR
jgi:hypothetical protein